MNLFPPPSSPTPSNQSQSMQPGPPITPVRDDPRFTRSTLPSHWPALKYVDESFSITLEAIPPANAVKPVVNPFTFAEMQGQSTLYAQHKREISRIRRHQSTAAVMMTDHNTSRSMKHKQPFQPLFPLSTNQLDSSKQSDNTPPPHNQSASTKTPPLMPLQKSFSSPATLRSGSIVSYSMSNNSPSQSYHPNFHAVPATPSNRIIKRRKAATTRVSVTPNNENQPPSKTVTPTSCDMSMTPDSTPKTKSPFTFRHPLYPVSHNYQTRHDIAKLREATLSIDNTTP